MRVNLSLITALFLVFGSAHAQTIDSTATITAVRAVGSISVDGRLNEPDWNSTVPFSTFKQRDPNEGDAVTERTQIRFLYGDNALFIGVELFDQQPSGIVARSSRRDTFPDSDNVTIYLDPYHDRLTGAMFQVSAAGGQQDWVISNDTQQDISWDAVWSAAVSRNEAGWFAEIEIPFSQLGFARAERYTWGVNAARFIHRKNETAWIQMTPRGQVGLASRFVNLDGLEGIEPGSKLEILPYVRSSIEQAPAEDGNPFRDGSRFFGGAGVDIKYGLSTNLTLDLTVNPDFGQVEVDPAVVNLSAFETFFQERRPFFVEGSQIFNNFGRGGVGGSGGVAFPTYFYSRRIGRSPQGSASGDHVDKPSAATILTAAKLTGKTSSGWSMGVLNAITDSEFATVIDDGERSSVQVEPVVNHFAARVLREFRGRAGVGLLATGVDRQLSTSSLQETMPRRSRMLGGDAYYVFDERRIWSVNGRFTGSWVDGDPLAIEKLQKSSQRYFQRSDATHVRLDPTATSLNGWGGGFFLGRNNGGFRVTTSVSAMSPGFDINDSGFQNNSDVWGTTAQFLWRQLRPDGLTRFREIIVNKNDSWSFGRERKNNYLGAFGNLQFLNYWGLNYGVNFNARTLDDRLTRGGPLSINSRDRNFNFYTYSDGRKRITFGMGGFFSSNENGGWTANSNLNIGVKPTSSVSINFEPNFNRSRTVFQYVKTVDDATAEATFGKRYVFADLDQSSAGLTTRLNYSLSPRMSLQVFSQFLFSVGDYWDFKELERPRTASFRKYDEALMSRSEDDYTVDPDGVGPAEPFTFDDPDFNFKSLRVNAVFRWEWKPGSTLFLVWTQNRSDDRFPGVLSPSRDVRALFGAEPTNIFLVKTTYWFNR